MDRSPEFSPCIFCRIITGESPAKVIYRDDMVMAFRDIHPIASTHILVIPIRHIESVNDLKVGDEALIGHMVLLAKQLAEDEGLSGRGYRLLINTGTHAGQTVLHLHLHLFGGPLVRLALR